MGGPPLGDSPYCTACREPACWRAGMSVDSKGDTHTVDPQRRHMSRFGSEVEANLARRSLLLLGQKATLHGDRHMSVQPQKSDITDLWVYVLVPGL